MPSGTREHRIMPSKTIDDWQTLASSLSIEGRAIIDGKYVVTSATFATRNPATRQTLCEISECAEFEVNMAVEAARRAFDSGRWARLPPRERKSIMLQLAELLRAHDLARYHVTQLQNRLIGTLDGITSHLKGIGVHRRRLSYGSG